MNWKWKPGASWQVAPRCPIFHHRSIYVTLKALDVSDALYVLFQAGLSLKEMHWWQIVLNDPVVDY